MLSCYRLSIPIMFFCILLFTSGCQFGREQQAHRADELLDEADLLIELRRLDDADRLATKALEELKPLLEQEPTHVDFRLVRARALMTQFIARNAVVIDTAPPRPRSLVRMPAVGTYVDYDSTAGLAAKELKAIINEDMKLTVEQTAYVHGSLGAILRLDVNTAPVAVQEYQLALDAYQKQLKKLQQEDAVRKIGSNEMPIARLKNQISGLKMAQAEVNLLLERWQAALKQLREGMGGDDLEYFKVQFQLLEEYIARTEAKLSRDDRMTKDPRVERWQKNLGKRVEGKLSNREKLAQMNPYKAALIQARIELANTQNNLLYRIICYRRLNLAEKEERARQTLREFYPELDIMLEANLSQ